MMDNQILERRRLLQMITLGSIAAPAVALAGCASDPGSDTPQRRLFRQGGGNRGGEKGGGRRG
jgi:hypothetical protein